MTTLPQQLRLPSRLRVHSVRHRLAGVSLLKGTTTSWLLGPVLGLILGTGPTLGTESAKSRHFVQLVKMSLEEVFTSYAAFGAGKGGATTLENAKFAKLCRESGIVSGKLTPASIDMAFTKAKAVGGRTIDFGGFTAALHTLAAEIAGKGVDSSAAFAGLCEKIIAHGGPSVAGATSTATGGGIFSKLTDASKYTGAHKERFE